MTVRMVVTLISVLAMLTAAVPVLRKLQVAMQRESPALTAGRQAPDQDPAPRPAVVTVPHAVTVYRWRDAAGTVHYESQPPPQGVVAEAIEMRGTKAVPAPAVPGASARVEPAAGTLNPLSVYTGDGMERFMERLDRTLDALGERSEALEELEEQL